MEAESVRLFFALYPPAPVRHLLTEWQAALQPVCGGRPTAPANLHLTLAFLGDMPLAQVPAIHAAAEPVHGAAFDLCINQVQSWRHNRIVWAGPAHLPDALGALAASLRAELLQRKLRFDAKPFVPHITLFRNAQPGASLPALPAIAWRVEDFVLMKAARGAAPRYEVAARWRL